ncbi:MAG: MerR family transcriptional regulator [Tissierella sp.]|nr:MerR family transcriptional regulator [Tissierella sp.]
MIKMQNSYLIGEFSEMTGIPIRTLYYYDEMGLLKPDRQKNGHRVYKLNDMVKLQKILSLKSLGFSLVEIDELLKKPSYDQSFVEMLKYQKELLQLKLTRIEESLKFISRIMMIFQSEEQLEHQLLFSFIRNMKQENIQSEWVANHLSEYAAKKMFAGLSIEMVELDSKTIHFTRDVKRLSEGPVDSQEAETVIGTYVKWAMTFFDQKAMDNFRSMNEEEQIKFAQIVERPFDELEMEWLGRALEHYFSKYSISE